MDENTPARKLRGPAHAHYDGPCDDSCYEPAAGPEPLNITGLIRDAWEIMALLGVIDATEVLPELRKRLTEAEPQQADASPLLDLVQQHASYYAAAVAFEPGSANASAHHKAADEVFARIAALVPPREPRTAAAIWAALTYDERERQSEDFPDLAEALDREAGLSS